MRGGLEAGRIKGKDMDWRRRTEGLVMAGLKIKIFDFKQDAFSENPCQTIATFLGVIKANG